MLHLPYFPQFVAASCITGIGGLLFYNVVSASRGNARAERLLADFPNDATRAVAAALSLVALWVGIRLAHSVSVPDRWFSLTEMGWVVLVSTAIASTIFVRHSALAKWMLGLSIIGLATMAYAVSGYVKQLSYG